MINAATVSLWGTHIGTVSFEEGSPSATFEYEGSFLPSGIQLSPLTMPLSARLYSFPALPERTFHGLPGLLADSLPDRFGNAVINAWLTSQGRAADSLTAIERLCYTGSRGMGALEYAPAIGPDAASSDTIDLDRLVRLASDILTQRQGMSVDEDEGSMEQIIRVGTSAGGARAKALIAWNENEGIIKSGQIEAGQGFGYWLMKFDGIHGNRDHEGEDSPQYTKIEFAYHLMALHAGLKMSECRLYEDGPRMHFLTRRFDRDEKTGEKLHMQTLGALTHSDFNNPGSYGYEQAAAAMVQLGLGQSDIEELFRRMAFNVVARNQDDHVKNISFLMDKRGRWSLAPAYDVTYAYNPNGLWTGSHQMTVNGKRDGITLDDLISSAQAMNIRAAKARGIIADVETAASKWLGFADDAGLDEELAEQIEGEFVTGLL